MNNLNQAREPKGSPGGGRWTEDKHAETEGVSLTSFADLEGFDELEAQADAATPWMSEGVDMDALSKKSVHVRYASANNVDPETGQVLTYSGLAPRDANPLDRQFPGGVEQVPGVREWRSNNPGGKVEAVYFRDQANDQWRYGAIDKETGELIGLHEAAPVPVIHSDDPKDVADFKRKASIEDARRLSKLNDNPAAQVAYVRSAQATAHSEYAHANIVTAQRLAERGYSSEEAITAAFDYGFDHPDAPSWGPDEAERVALLGRINKGLSSSNKAIHMNEGEQTRPDLMNALEKADIDDLRALRDALPAPDRPGSRSHDDEKIIELVDKNQAKRLRAGRKLDLSASDLQGSAPIKELAEIRDNLPAKTGELYGPRVEANLEEVHARGWRGDVMPAWRSVPEAINVDHEALIATKATPAQLKRWSRTGELTTESMNHLAIALKSNQANNIGNMTTLREALERVEKRSGQKLTPENTDLSDLPAGALKGWSGIISHPDDFAAVKSLAARGIRDPGDLIFTGDGASPETTQEWQRIRREGSPAPLASINAYLEDQDNEVRNTPANEMSNPFA